MEWKIEFLPEARKELNALDKEAARRILRFLGDRVAVDPNPRRFGEPLRGPALGKYWRYRVGDYRIIAAIQNEEITIIIVRIGHRKDVYR